MNPTEQTTAATSSHSELEKDNSQLNLDESRLVLARLNELYDQVLEINLATECQIQTLRHSLASSHLEIVYIYINAKGV